MGDRGVTYGLKYQARALVALQAENQKSRWLVGTNSLREDNEVHTFDSQTSLRAFRSLSLLDSQVIRSYPQEHL